MLSVHPSRKTALITPDLMQTKPTVPAKEYVDGFGNIGHVIHATAGMMTDGGWIIGQIAFFAQRRPRRSIGAQPFRQFLPTYQDQHNTGVTIDVDSLIAPR
jgi:hypothetical protein